MPAPRRAHRDPSALLPRDSLEDQARADAAGGALVSVDQPTSVKWLRVPCPFCGAGVGTLCRGWTGNAVMWTHAERVDEYMWAVAHRDPAVRAK